jgi:hypothetical protein
VDEPVPMTASQRGTVLRFGPDRRLTAVVGLVTVVLAVAAALTSDPAGRLLLALAALLLAAYTASDVIFRPRITATRDAVVLNAPFARATLAWSEIDSIAADVRSRHGLRTSALEIDAGPVLAVFSRRALGTDPSAAAGLLQALDPRGPSASEGRGRHGDDDSDQHGDSTQAL